MYIWFPEYIDIEAFIIYFTSKESLADILVAVSGQKTHKYIEESKA